MYAWGFNIAVGRTIVLARPVQLSMPSNFVRVNGPTAHMGENKENHSKCYSRIGSHSGVTAQYAQSLRLVAWLIIMLISIVLSRVSL